MKLERVTDRIWIYPMEERRDRPVLGYVRGDNYSLAVDAGHSDAHVAEFYEAIEKEGLPLPKLTVLTHWHWDHTFGMHCINGLSIANGLTNKHLREIREKVEKYGVHEFLDLHESIRYEYADNRPVKIVTSDIEFSGEAIIDIGGCKVRAFQVPSPHTDDSTLVEVVDEKVLFIGDAACGSFPDWNKDQVITRELADIIDATGVDCCIEGHWTPHSRADYLADILSDI